MVNIQLERDDKIRDRWRVVRKLAEGGFGAVFMAVDDHSKDKEEVAVKLEPSDQNSVLKMEAYVLMELRGRSAHACAFLGCGRQGGMNYLVMTLVGRSLSDLQKSRPDRKFAPSTVARLAWQCIEALEDVHNIGFVHRDVKPGNLAIGRKSDDKRYVYILDFGLARVINHPDNRTAVRPARERVGFRGTVRYASANVHDGREQGRHDDLISLMYVLIEFRMGRLPWNDVDSDDEVGRMKKKMSPAQLTKDMEPEYKEMFEKLVNMNCKERPHYRWMIERIAILQKQRKYAEDGPFEWE